MRTLVASVALAAPSSLSNAGGAGSSLHSGGAVFALRGGDLIHFRRVRPLRKFSFHLLDPGARRGFFGASLRERRLRSFPAARFSLRPVISVFGRARLCCAAACNGGQRTRRVRTPETCLDPSSCHAARH